MEQSYGYQSSLSKLYALYVEQGFLRDDEALKMMADDDVSLVDINRITDKLISMGVIFANSDANNEDDIDYAFTDYATIFKEVLEISPSQCFLMNYIRNIRPPQNREWQILIPQMNSGNDYAFNRLFDMYLRVVVKIAMRFYKDGGIELEDAIQEGAMGLIRAMRQFDIGKHEKFGPYLSLWIQQYISRAVIDTGRTIRIPVHMFETLKQFQNTTYELEQLNGRTATIAELSAKLGIDSNEVKNLKNNFSSIESIESMLKECELFFSDGEEKINTLINNLTNDLLIFHLNSILNTLPSREANIIRLRYGIGSEKPQTLEQVGEMYNLTRERIRQIEKKAMRRLRHPKRHKTLKKFYEYEVNIKFDLKTKKQPEFDFE